MRRAFALLVAPVLSAAIWPGCDYPKVSFGPPPPDPVVKCSADGIDCINGNVCCFHSIETFCDKCVPVEQCETLTTCDGNMQGKYVPISCDSADDCYPDEYCCLFDYDADNLVDRVECAPKADCAYRHCVPPETCDPGLECGGGLATLQGYEALTFCLPAP
jgi:hypothetical protein